MQNNTKANKLSYLGWSCILHTGAMLLVIFNPRTDDLKKDVVEITFQVAGDGINLGSKKGDSLQAKKAKSASNKNKLNDSLLSELEKKISNGSKQEQTQKIAAPKATNTQAASQKTSSLEEELSNDESDLEPAVKPTAVTKNNPTPPAENLAQLANNTDTSSNSEQESFEEELNDNSSAENNIATPEESGLRNLVKNSPVSVPRQQVLGKRGFKSSRTSTLGKQRNSSNRESNLGQARSSAKRESVFGKRTANKNYSNALGGKRNSATRASAFGKRKNTNNRASALGQARKNSKNRASAFGKRNTKARAASLFGRNSNSTSSRPSGSLGKRNQSGGRKGSIFARGKGNSNKTRAASALGSSRGKGKRSYGNAFGRGGAGSGPSFGLPEGIRDARSLKQIPGNPVPSYPYSARVRKNQGIVFLVYYVDRFGKVSQVKVHKSSGFSNLDTSASKAIARYRYYQGQSGYVIHPIEFTLSGTAKVQTHGKSNI